MFAIFILFLSFVTFEDKQVGDLEEVSPVSAAIARHLGIDLSLEGRAARNRCGIAIIVHGAPISGTQTNKYTF